jgi:hypothetical protein
MRASPLQLTIFPLSFQMNPNRMPERNSFLITDFARKRTKARRR